MTQFLAQLQSNRLKIALILIISTLLTGLVILLNLWKEIPIDQLLRDPVAALGVPFYTGFFSQIGIFFWSGTAAVCIFCAKLISKKPETLKIRRFFIFSGLLTLLLGLDDIFLPHEEVFPYYLGVPEKGVFLVYGGLVGYFLIKFHLLILKTAYVLLVMALLFFGLSMVIDVALFQFSGAVQLLIEDHAKIIGIASWFFYFFYTAIAVVSNYCIQNNLSHNDSIMPS